MNSNGFLGLLKAFWGCRRVDFGMFWFGFCLVGFWFCLKVVFFLFGFGVLGLVWFVIVVF